MNVNTGHLEYLTMAEFEQQAKLGAMIPVDMESATDKQKAEMQVSKHDNRSELGKMLPEAGETRNEHSINSKRNLDHENSRIDTKIQ